MDTQMVSYQTIYNLTGLSLPEYYQPTSHHTRHHHPLDLIIPPSINTAHNIMSSFFKHHQGLQPTTSIHH